MKIRLTVLRLAVTLAGGVALVKGQTAAAIPEGKGSATAAGKFVPAVSEEKEKGKAVKPEEAEKQLRTALKVEELGAGKYQIGKVKFDAGARTVSVPAKVNMRGGVIEYVLTTEAGKAHEAMLTTTASPRDVHLACLLLGMKAAAVTGEVHAAMTVPAAESVRIAVSWETNGPAKMVPLASLLQVAEGGPDGPKSAQADGAWHYTGSVFSGSGQFAAEAEGSFISLIRDPAALLNNPDKTRDDDGLHVPNTANLPVAGTPVTVIFQLPAVKP